MYQSATATAMLHNIAISVPGLICQAHLMVGEFHCLSLRKFTSEGKSLLRQEINGAIEMRRETEQRLGLLSIVLSVTKLSLERLVLPRIQLPELCPVHSPGSH